jgi:hypothetical protein
LELQQSGTFEVSKHLLDYPSHFHLDTSLYWRGKKWQLGCLTLYASAETQAGQMCSETDGLFFWEECCLLLISYPEQVVILGALAHFGDFLWKIIHR